jgi:hypothetical protein
MIENFIEPQRRKGRKEFFLYVGATSDFVETVPDKSVAILAVALR